MWVMLLWVRTSLLTLAGNDANGSAEIGRVAGTHAADGIERAGVFLMSIGMSWSMVTTPCRRT